MVQCTKYVKKWKHWKNIETEYVNLHEILIEEEDDEDDEEKFNKMQGPEREIFYNNLNNMEVIAWRKINAI